MNFDLPPLIPPGLPWAARLPLAAAALGLAWWRFGPRAGRPRPGAVWAAGCAAAWLVVGGDGATWLVEHGAAAWLPVCIVGAAGTFPLVRGEWRGARLTGRRRAWYAAAVGLILCGPPLALLDSIGEARRATVSVVRDLFPAVGYELWEWMSAALGGAMTAAAAAAVIAASGVADDAPGSRARPAPLGNGAER